MSRSMAIIVCLVTPTALASFSWERWVTLAARALPNTYRDKIYILKAIAEEVGLEEGDRVEVSVEGLRSWL